MNTLQETNPTLEEVNSIPQRTFEGILIRYPQEALKISEFIIKLNDLDIRRKIIAALQDNDLFTSIVINYQMFNEHEPDNNNCFELTTKQSINNFLDYLEKGKPSCSRNEIEAVTYALNQVFKTEIKKHEVVKNTNTFNKLTQMIVNGFKG